MFFCDKMMLLLYRYSIETFSGMRQMNSRAVHEKDLYSYDAVGSDSGCWFFQIDFSVA